MRKLFFFMLLLFMIVWFYGCVARPATKVNLNYTVTGSITETFNYCGGARPPKEILEKYNIPKGISFAKLGVKMPGSENIIEMISADSGGLFSIKLPAGKYCLVEDWKTKPFKLPADNDKEKVDTACYRNLYNSCNFELIISNQDIKNVVLTYRRPCFYNKPCIAYKGPLLP